MALYDGIAGTIEIDDGDTELVGANITGHGVAMVEAQDAAAAAGTYEGYSFVGLPV